MTRRSDEVTPVPGDTVVPRWLPFVYLCLLVLVTFALRVVRLDILPLSLSLDESVDGLDALQLLRTHWLTPFLQNNFGRETLFLYVQGVALHLYGISFFALRFASVWVGTLTVPLTYAVGRQLAMDEKWLPRPLARTLTGLLAATGLAVCYWHIYFSRQALRAILLPPLLLATVWCFWRGWHAAGVPTRRRWLWLAVAGILLGLALYTYLAARLLPFLIVLPAMVELARSATFRKERAIGLLICLGMTALVSIPLVLYFVRYPYAFAGRTDTIAIPFDGTFLAELAENLVGALVIQFGGGVWWGNWPSLDLLTGLGLLAGLVVCLRASRRSAAWFLVVWWMLGFAPVVLSRQDWSAVTTILRGVVAWPAVCLISANGLTALTGLLRRWAGDMKCACAGRGAGYLAIPALVLLLLGGGVSAHSYFSVWATSIDQTHNDARVMAGYLNSQTQQLTLAPNQFYADAATNFLLQSRYPNLVSIQSEEARRLISSRQAEVPAVVPAVYVMPHGESTPSAWVLLQASTDGVGTAYLLPVLTRAQTDMLAEATKHTVPLASIADPQHDILADVYPLDAGAPVLPADLPMQPVSANFAGDVLLNGYHIEPPVVKHGQEVALFLRWQAQRPIDGDHDVFLHLFNVQTGQRVGQINGALGNSILLHTHRWPAGLTVVDVHTFTLPANAPEGAYRFEVGLYHRTSLARLPVATGDGQPVAGDRVVVGKFLLQDRPPQPPQHTLEVIFQDNIALTGVDLRESDGGAAAFALHWQALGPISRDYTIFAHLLDERGSLVAQQDNMPQAGHYPTSLWSPGEVVVDPYVLNVPRDAPDGRYVLQVGLYDLSTGERLRLADQARDNVGVLLWLADGRFSLVLADGKATLVGADK